ncbi:MAG TPA: hypothetical protein VKU41_19770 [Polyangiaceae bacterium]|nr:hypothetical protein [Polyangiaceae bacterium]
MTTPFVHMIDVAPERHTKYETNLSTQVPWSPPSCWQLCRH